MVSNSQGTCQTYASAVKFGQGRHDLWRTPYHSIAGDLSATADRSRRPAPEAPPATMGLGAADVALEGRPYDGAPDRLSGWNPVDTVVTGD
ncbi:MAG: hypothetical protein IID13_05340 [Candidatus Marinimicrobia bacterium]|nr:hypothetical protein [Candidatus Neomarinimicrobiota bacterium]